MKMLTRSPFWHRLRREMNRPIVREGLAHGCAFLGSFCLSATNFALLPQPVCLGVLCAGLPGWLPMSYALGGSLGYWLFWGQEGLQGLFWLAAGLPVCCLVRHKDKLSLPLVSLLAALIVASGGVIFQVWQGKQTEIPLYLLRIAVAFGAATVAQLVRQREPLAQALALGVGVLALTQIGMVPYCNFGVAVAAALSLCAPFPAVAMVGFAVDLTGITPVPMTAVLCLTYFVGLVPSLPKYLRPSIPALVYLGVMALCSQQNFEILPALCAGGVVSLWLPRRQKSIVQGKIGTLQHRLEMVSGVLAQAEQLLREATLNPVDESALIAKAASRACGDCPCRENCPEAVRVPYLPLSLLHGSGIAPEQLPEACEKKGRLYIELQRSQDQLRLLKADRDRQQEYRTAVMQQYRFLSDYLLDESEAIARGQEPNPPRFVPEVAVCTRGKEAANGDKALWFAGVGSRYYVLLCDGMGTGDGAAFESRTAGNFLRRLLVAGFPAKYALRSLNSLCALRGVAGAVTVDLAEADLQTGRATLYKWGAAPSWILAETGPERIGREGPPPGISLEETQETVDRFSLQQGAPLVLLSDGVDGYGAMGALEGDFSQPAGFLAALLLEAGKPEVPDDATAAVLRLHPIEKK